MSKMSKGKPCFEPDNYPKEQMPWIIGQGRPPVRSRQLD